MSCPQSIPLILRCESWFRSFTSPFQVEKELEQLEQEINPALDENAQVALSFILGKATEAMKAVPDVSLEENALPFLWYYFRSPSQYVCLCSPVPRMLSRLSILDIKWSARCR